MSRGLLLVEPLLGLSAVWSCSEKRILRTLLREIVVDVDAGEMILTLHWKGGVHTSYSYPASSWSEQQPDKRGGCRCRREVHCPDKTELLFDLASVFSVNITAIPVITAFP